MFRWYADSGRCIAFLEDVHQNGRSFEESEWFRRGWTLQELIAPMHMSFYDHDWQLVVTKDELLDILSQATGVQRSILSHTEKPESCSVAQRMSWAAGRITERVEDRAYSLLGLFNVTLEMVYGEREKAFIRLQEKIIQHTADQSVFAWSLDRRNHPNGYSGLLAPSPDSFADCSDIVKVREQTAFSLSNIGLSIYLPTLPYSMEAYLAFLDCSQERNAESRFAILVSRLPSTDQWARIMNQKGNSLFLRTLSKLGQSRVVKRQLYIRQVPLESPICFTRIYGFWFRRLEPLRKSGRVGILSRIPTSAKDRVYLRPGMIGTAGVVSVKPFQGRPLYLTQVRCIKVGFDEEFRPVIMFANKLRRSFAEGASRNFCEATTSGPGSSAHSRLFGNYWLRDSRYKHDQRLPNAEDRWLDGFYILAPRTLPKENDSLIYHDLDALNIRVQLSLLPDHNQEGGTSGSSYSPQFIWTIDLFELEGAPLRWTYWRAQGIGLAKGLLGSVFASNDHQST